MSLMILLELECPVSRIVAKLGKTAQYAATTKQNGLKLPWRRMV